MRLPAGFGRAVRIARRARASRAALTLKMPATDPVQIPRSEITVLRSNDRSLMPDGLEDELSQRDMADLLEFIVNTKPSK